MHVPKNNNKIVNMKLTLKRQVKSHLAFAGIIRSSPYTPH
jgi:hypothetical protein